MLAILTTHPIQYQVPLWQALAKDGRVPFEVWYLTSHAIQVSRDREFRQSFAWDLDMLEGYPHRFLRTPNKATPNTFWRCRILDSLPELLKKTNTQAIWIQGWQVAGYWQAAWAAKKVGVEVWLRGESNDLGPTSWWKQPIKRRLLGELFKRVDRFLYIGSANRRLYQKFNVPDEKLFSTPYAVDNERFATQANALRARRTELREHWRIPKDAFCILFCGKFIAKKRPMGLIDAAKLLMRSHPNSKTHLLFVGSGELGAQLRAACNVVFDAERPDNKELMTDNTKLRASFTGFLNQTQVSRAYVAADVLALPSDYDETWGLVVNEAMASGLPCIISDRCGCAEDLGRIGPNMVFPCGNVNGFALALRSIAARTFTQSTIAAPPGFSVTVNAIQKIYSWVKK